MGIRDSGQRWMFDLSAEFYAWMTWQDVWREHCGSLVDHFGVEGVPPSELQILDLGIGPGVSGIGILDRLPGARLVGVDYSARMLKVARRYCDRAGKPIELVYADAGDLPFEDGRFDVVTGHSFLYLLPHKEQVIKEIARVLKPGGRAAFLEPHEHGSHLTWMKMEGRKRFKLSMMLWRAVSGRIGRFEARSLRALLERELVDVEAFETLDGLGLVGVGSSADGDAK